MASSRPRPAPAPRSAAAKPAQARLTFAEDELSASVGCNGIGGPWQVEQNRLIAGPLASTEMYCVGPVGEQEKALAALLVAAPTIALGDGELVLRSSRHTIRLERINPRNETRKAPLPVAARGDQAIVEQAAQLVGCDVTGRLAVGGGDLLEFVLGL